MPLRLSLYVALLILRCFHDTRIDYGRIRDATPAAAANIATPTRFSPDYAHISSLSLYATPFSSLPDYTSRDYMAADCRYGIDVIALSILRRQVISYTADISSSY
jgi:hypothetical protein